MLRRREIKPSKRAEFLWILGGFVIAQLVLAAGVDRFWTRVRDPEFAGRLERLQDRRTEAPTKPLALILGSSRSELGIRASMLNQPDVADAPLVFNFAIPGSGPMLQQIVLRRLLAEGVRPAHLFVEVMALSMSRRGGTPQEENQLDSARLTAAEIVRLAPYYCRPYHLFVPWGTARLLPADRHQAEFRDAIGVDGGGWVHGGTDAALGPYGWRRPPTPPLPHDLAGNARFALGQYAKALADATPADGPILALRDLLALCRGEDIPTTLVIPPEATIFRDRGANHAAIETEIRRAAGEFGARLYDARAWMDDAAFYDGHHLSAAGAECYTERFRREVLAPELSRDRAPH